MLFKIKTCGVGIRIVACCYVLLVQGLIFVAFSLLRCGSEFVRWCFRSRVLDGFGSISGLKSQSY